jgi:hypothetical protein
MRDFSPIAVAIVRVRQQPSGVIHGQQLVRLAFQFGPPVGNLHVQLDCPDAHPNVVFEPRQPLTVGKMSLGLKEKLPGLLGVLNAVPHDLSDLLVFVPNLVSQPGQQPAVSELGKVGHGGYSREMGGGVEGKCATLRFCGRLDHRLTLPGQNPTGRYRLSTPP